ncbi:MAG: hypothetical protein QOE19_1575 [Actinomycetota bacterium]|nr:hypothetical protein [Actinomycetota bacterium]
MAGVAAAALTATLLPAADIATAATRPAAIAMPASLQPGTYTKAVFPESSVPAYVTPTRIRTRVKPGNGGLDGSVRIDTPPGSTSVWGDWDGNGTTSPAVFTNGQWLVYNAVIGGTPPPGPTLSFGIPGDRPIAGDWNGDGKTDIGIVRGNQWSLSLGTVPAGVPGTPQKTWRSFVWGAPTDQVVVGDWNGDRVDGIGVMRGGAWFLRQTPSAGKTDISLTFGVPKITKKKVKGTKKKKTTVTSTFRPGDVAVVGDWNADKTDTVGVVRGSTWYLRDRNKTGDRLAEQTRVVTRPAGGVPAPWRTQAGPTAAACPTAKRAVPAYAKYVVPSKILDKSLPHVGTAEPGYSARNALLQTERYVVGAQYAERWAGDRYEPFTDVRATSRNEEFAIRRPAMSALTAAVAVSTKAHVDKTVGRTRDEVTQYADWLVRSIACTHASVTPAGWGSGWQTAHWASMAGMAAWLIWDRLTPQTREYVASMIVSESNFRLGQPATYWTDKAGTVKPGFEGNTRAEENSWNSTILELAVNMMPNLPLRAAYRAKAIELEVAAYATRADMSNPAPINGVPLSQRLQGSNALDDGTVINHGRLHPDYATNIQHLWWAADLAGLAGKATPRAAFHNAGLVYDSMSLLSFPAGGPSPAGGVYDQPGGTIYQPGTNNIYYPQGSDWGIVRRAPFMSFDAHALVYGAAFSNRGPGAWNPVEALVLHTRGQLGLVSTNGVGDGRSYSIDPNVAVTQDTYPGREEYASQQVATAWLALYVGRNSKLRIDDGSYPAPAVTAFKKSEAWRGWREPGTSSSQREQLSP